MVNQFNLTSVGVFHRVDILLVDRMFGVGGHFHTTRSC